MRHGTRFSCGSSLTHPLPNQAGLARPSHGCSTERGAVRPGSTMPIAVELGTKSPHGFGTDDVNDQQVGAEGWVVRKGGTMRRLTARDAFATVLAAAVAVPYVGYLVRGEMPFINDPRGMAGVGIVGLILSFVAWGIGIRSTFGKVMLVVGLATLGVGIAAAFVGAEGSELLLAIFMGAIAVVYIAETGYHALFGEPEGQTA